MARAECRKSWVNPEWFFPKRGKSNDQRMAEFSCFVCPVNQECEVYVQNITDPYGVWAGKNRQTMENE